MLWMWSVPWIFTLITINMHCLQHIESIKSIPKWMDVFANKSRVHVNANVNVNDGSSKLLYDSAILLYFSHHRNVYPIFSVRSFIHFFHSATHYVRVVNSDVVLLHMSTASIQQFSCSPCQRTKSKKRSSRSKQQKTNFQLSSHQSRTTFAQL